MVNVTKWVGVFLSVLFLTSSSYAKVVDVSGDMIWGGFVDPPQVTETRSNIYFDIHQIWNFEGSLQGFFEEFVTAKLNLHSLNGVARPSGDWTGSIEGQSGTLRFEARVQFEALDLANNVLGVHFHALMSEGTEGLEGWLCNIQGDLIQAVSGTYSGFCVTPDD